MIYGSVTISPDPFLAIVAASALAGTITVVFRFGSVVVPAVVLELVFGIVIGPEVLGIKVTPPISFFADLGLGLLSRRERHALALLSSTQLPLVVAITALATSSGHMRSSTAAALVGAALLSTLVFPILGLRVAKRARDPAAQEGAGPVAAVHQGAQSGTITV